MTNKNRSRDVLAAPMGPNDADAKTIGDYFKTLMIVLWYEGEGFGGKRPFGNSGWEGEVYTALANAGFISGIKNIDDPDYTYWEDMDEQAGDKIIREALQDASVMVPWDA